MDTEPTVHEGDLVEILPGAPLPAGPRFKPGMRAHVLLVDEPGPGWIVVQCGVNDRPLRLQRRWLRLVSW
jgi:hypothetical protein